MIVIGLGTGRSGSYSLSALLDAQEGFNVTHEVYWCPWEKDKVTVEVMMAGFRGKGNVGDVACYLLPYVEEFLSVDPTIKFVVIKRGREDTVESWLRHTDVNHWTRPDSEFFEGKQNFLSFCFPKYDLPRKDALEKYWDDYYAISEALEFMYPDNVKVFGMEALKTQDEILDFIGIKNKVYGDFWLNKGGEQLIIKKKMDFPVGECKCGNEGAYYLLNKTLGITDYICEGCNA